MSRDILLSQIDPNPNQPRKFFDEVSLNELAESIKANGLAVPILVRPNGDRFEIVHGERRYKAIRSLGWDTIPADVRDLSPDDAQWLALVENIQRNDLSPIEEAKAYQSRLDEGMTQTELGQRIGKTQSYIATKLRLLKLSQEVQKLIDDGQITEGHGKQLLRLATPEQAAAISDHIIDKRLGVAMTKRLIDAEMMMFYYLDFPLESWDDWHWMKEPLSDFHFSDVAKLSQWFEDNWDNNGLVDGFLPKHTHVCFVAGDYLNLSQRLWDDDKLPWLGHWVLESATIEQMRKLKDEREMLKDVGMTIADYLFLFEHMPSEEQWTSYFDEFSGGLQYPIERRDFTKNLYRFMFDKAQKYVT